MASDARSLTSSPLDLHEAVLAPWSTSCRVTDSLIDRIPEALWAASLPGMPTRSIRAIGAHLHNSRCSWTRTLGQEHGIVVPVRVDRRKVTRRQLSASLKKSGRAIAILLKLGCSQGGRIPPSRAYVWRNLALDVGHVLTYFVAHEAHHRGQIVLVARQLDARLAGTLATRLWEWRPRPPERSGSRSGRGV